MPSPNNDMVDLTSADENNFDMIEEQQWEVLDDNEQINDYVYYDSSLEEQDIIDLDETQLLINKGSNTNETTDNDDKFYCMECKSLFSDLDTAELHDCPAINATEYINAEDDLNNDEELSVIRADDFSNVTEYNAADEGHYDDVTSLQQQSGMMVLPKEFLCFLCKTSFFTMDNLKLHQLDCAKIEKKVDAKDEKRCEPKISGSHQCTHCNAVFTTSYALYGHQSVHKHTNKHIKKTKETSEDEIVCHICNTIFSSAKNLKLHMRIHDKRETKSIQQALPVGAVRAYNKKNQFYCEICHKSFERSLFAVHKQMHTKYEDFECRICNRQFENMPSYEIHMQMHDGKKPNRLLPQPKEKSVKGSFPCQYCGRSFPRPHEKVKHERVHTGEKPYECEVCGKTFRVSYSLTLHLRTHTNIRPFVCPTCNKRFKSYPVYVHHMRTHIDEWPYQCNICPKSFRTSVQLYSHRNSHLKPFSCPECNRPFATMYAVKIHVKTHSKSNILHENLKHRCKICGAEYARLFALRSHMEELHQADLNSKTFLEDSTAVLNAALKGDDEYGLVEEELSETETATQHLTDSVCELDELTTPEELLDNAEIVIENYTIEEIVDDWSIA